MKHIVEQAKPRWFVVNMCNRWGDTKLQRTHKPQLVFYSLAEAYAHAVEMANQHSRGDYAVFECVGRIVSDPENPPGKPGLREPAEVLVENATSTVSSIAQSGKTGAALKATPRKAVKKSRLS